MLSKAGRRHCDMLLYKEKDLILMIFLVLNVFWILFLITFLCL